MFAGNGIGDIIIGGPDVIVGLLRDDDEICGGDGDDNIQGGDGDDAIYDGVGINIINGGLGINTIVMGKGPVPNFAMPRGPERRGKWAELSGSATQGGLSHEGEPNESVG